MEILVSPTQSGTEVPYDENMMDENLNQADTKQFLAQEETLRLKRIAAASEKPHDTPSYSSTTVTAVSFWLCCSCNTTYSF